MSGRLMVAFSFLALIFSSLVASGADAPAARPPNIIFLLADDLGYGDVSCFGQQKFRTPNIDRLATDGMKMGGREASRARMTIGRPASPPRVIASPPT